ncbi:hypothetical protein D3C78_238460 [compost metagenome]
MYDIYLLNHCQDTSVRCILLYLCVDQALLYREFTNFLTADNMVKYNRYKLLFYFCLLTSSF